MLRFFATAAYLGGALFLLTPEAAAQGFFDSSRRAVQSVSVGVFLIEFEFDGEEEPLFSFDYAAPAYSLVYTRPNFVLTAGYGQQAASDDQEALRLVDLTISTWGALYSVPFRDGTRGFLPLVLFSNYRHVAPRGAGDSFADAFNVTVLGLGAGVGLTQFVGENGLFEVRVHPIFGLASSSFTDAIGSARLLDADAQLHLGRIFRRAGLTLGYTFRMQVWNVNASNLFPDLTDDLFDYRGQQHLVRLGINW